MTEQLGLHSKVSFIDVEEKHVRKIWTVLKVFRDTPGDQYKMRDALATAEKFSAVELWLLAFLWWAVTKKFMPRVNHFDYVMMTCSEKQTSKFRDFIMLIRHYRGHYIPRKTEKELVKFLIGCEDDLRDFYFMLLDQPVWLRHFVKNARMRDLSTLTEITVDDIYGNTALLSHGWLHITFPLWLTAMPKELPPAIITRTAKDQHIKIALLIDKKKHQVSYKREKLSYKWLKDRKFIHSNEFILLGRIDVEGGKFYAMDYFESFKEYNRNRKGKSVVPVQERLKQLDLFLDTNLTYQIEAPPRVYCPTSHDVEQKVSELLQKTAYTHVMAVDQRNRVHYINTIEKTGIVGGLWIDSEGITRGLNVWNCGQVVPCAFSFDGRLKALTYNPSHIIKKQVKFSWFAFDEYSVGAIREVLWDQKPYVFRKFTYTDGVTGMVEKCPICLTTRDKNDSHGMCKSCAKAMHFRLLNFGPEVWFPPSYPVMQRRESGDWSAEWINRCGIPYKGYQVICDPETGYLKFGNNEEFMKRQKQIRLKMYGLSDLTEIYKQQKALRVEEEEERERRSDQTKAVCRPAKLYEQDFVATLGAGGNLGDGEADDQTDSGGED